MSTTTQTLEGSHKLRASNIGRRVDGDDFRVGSYVVHTLPTTPTGVDGGGKAVGACKSSIPGYQFKSKIATISHQQQQSPPSSPNKGFQAERFWSPDNQNGNESLSSPSVGGADGGGRNARRHHYKLEQLNTICSPNNQINSSLANPTSPPSSSLPPKAIPRSMFSLKQQSNKANRISHSQEYEPNNMGDRLSSPAIQHIPYNSSCNLPSGAKHHHYSVDFDHWTGQLSPNSTKYELSQKDQVQIRQRNNSGRGIGSSDFSDEVFKLTPRLPRGVSKIPHQVHNLENINSNHYQSHESTIGNCLSNSNRYLTFSKDQATSHFKSLKEELDGQKRDANRQDKQSQFLTSSSSPITPKPLERLSKTIEANDNVEENDKFSTSATLRHQPICEAFIMTGQSMLKLSCNESENNNNTDSQKKTEAKSKSLSLNKLSNSYKKESHLNKENIDCSKFGPHQPSIDNENSILKEAPSDSPTKSDTIISTMPITTTPSTRMQTETKTTLFTALEAAPESDYRSCTKKNFATDISVGPAHQTAINIKQKIVTETKSSKETEPDSRHIELRDGFWNKAVHTKSTPIEPDQIKASRVETDKFHDGFKTQAKQTKLKQSTTGANQTTLPNSGDSYCDGSEKISTPIMSNSGQGKQTEKHHDSDLQIQEGNPCFVAPIATCNDRDSAKRLAKRLYNLSGFKKSDVCHHLAKSNPFSQMVSQEYVNLFDFRSMKLDGALRKFLSKLQLNGETQERERMLSQFSQRYYDCNKDKFPNADTVQTLVCALILLNTDLHGGHNKKKRSKLSLGAFIDGLNNSIAGGPDCGHSDGVVGSASAVNSTHVVAYTFPRHLLIDLYESIKKRPLKCGDDKCDMTSLEAELDKIYSQQIGNSRSNTLPTRRFAPGSNAPSSTLNASSRRHLKQGLNRLNSGCHDDPDTAIQFKSGYLNRKRVFEAHGKPTSKGRRSWRRVYVTLQDLRMIMQLGIHDESKDGDDQVTAKKAIRAQSITQKMKNTIKIHHAFAKRSTSYTKRDHVFQLRLADQSEFLLQVNSEQEMNSWIDTINFATACLSSPALPNAISSSKQHQPRNQRPLLPAAYTKLSYWEQLIDHEERLQRLKVELDEHLSEAPNTKNANKKFKTEFIEKIAFLKHEIERYTVYVDLMRKKSNSPEAIVLSKHPHIASFIPSDGMILSLPSFSPPLSDSSSHQTVNTSLTSAG